MLCLNYSCSPPENGLRRSGQIPMIPFANRNAAPWPEGRGLRGRVHTHDSSAATTGLGLVRRSRNVSTGSTSARTLRTCGESELGMGARRRRIGPLEPLMTLHKSAVSAPLSTLIIALLGGSI